MFNVVLDKKIEVLADDSSVSEIMSLQIDIRLPFAPFPGLGLPDQLARISAVTWLNNEEFICDTESFETTTEKVDDIINQHLESGWWFLDDNG